MINSGAATEGRPYNYSRGNYSPGVIVGVALRGHPTRQYRADSHFQGSLL